MIGVGGKPSLPGLVDAEPDAGAPTEPVAVARQAFDMHATFDAGHPVQLFDDPGSFESSLCRQGDVLEVTPAAAAGTGVGARGITRSGEATKNLRGVGAEERRRGRRDLRHDPFSGNRVPHEDDPPVGGVRNTAATAGDVAHLEFEEFAVPAPRIRHAANTR